MIVLIELVLIMFMLWFTVDQVAVPLIQGTPLFPMLRSSKERLLAKDLQAKLAALREEEKNQALLDEYDLRLDALEEHREAKNGRHQKDTEDEQQNSF